MFQAQQTSVNPLINNLPPVDPNHEKKQIQKSFPKRVMMLLSILQIVCGKFVFLMQISQYFVGYYRPLDFGLHYFGWGIWTGLIFAASGIVGLVGALKPSKCM